MKFRKQNVQADHAADLDETVAIGTDNVDDKLSDTNHADETQAEDNRGSDAQQAEDTGSAQSPVAGEDRTQVNERSFAIPTSHAEGENESDFGKSESLSSSKSPATGSQPKIVTKVEYADYQPRQVHLVVARIEPWTVMKVSFLLSVCLGIAMIVAGILVWLLLNSMHVFSSVENFINDIDPTGAVAELINYVRLPRVIAISTILAVANVILMTAFATVGALLYNLTSALVGGIKLALMDD